MSTFTAIVILGILMILGGVSLMATPLITFMSSGCYIIILFFIWGLFGLFRGIAEKRYNKEFFLSILSLILGIIGLVVPGAVAMTNSVLLYFAACWFILHGVMAIVNAIRSREEAGTGFMVIGVILGVLELIMAVYSVAHPAVLILSLGFLTAFYFIESGANVIFIGSAYAKAVALARRAV